MMLVLICSEGKGLSSYNTVDATASYSMFISGHLLLVVAIFYIDDGRELTRAQSNFIWQVRFTS